MQQTVQPNRTLLVDGPAFVQIMSGKAETFGKPLKETQRVMVRRGKRKPFYATEPLCLNLMLGANSAVKEVEGKTIPESWNKPIQHVQGLQKKPVLIIVMGATDSGKSSFCTYMLNKLVEGNHTVAVLDSDLGQSDVGPAGSVAYAIANKPVTELNNLRMENGFFVGATSPVNDAAKAIQGVLSMVKEATEKQVDYIVVNTDGFITGEAAIRYKLNLIVELRPDALVILKVKDEMDKIMSYLGGSGVMAIETSPALNQRNPETRKVLREMTYAKYLKRAKLQCIPIGQLVIEPRNGVPKMVYTDKGILVGLYGRGTKFLGIGILRAVNTTRKTLKIQTAVSTKPVRLVFGKVLLDRKFQEVQPVQA